MIVNRGFILLAVLLFLQIFTWIGILLFEQSIDRQKLLADQKAQRLKRQEAEHLLASEQNLEYLGRDECAYVAQIGPESVAEYYRIRAAGLEATIVKASANSQAHCEQLRHSVDLGQQSWRESDDGSIKG